MLTPSKMRTLFILSMETAVQEEIDAIIAKYPIAEASVPVAQLTRLSEVGMLEALGYEDSEFASLLANLPPVPTDLGPSDRIALAYSGPRLEHLGLIQACRLVGIDCYLFGGVAVARASASDSEGWYWSVYRDGRENHFKTPCQCRAKFKFSNRIELDAWEAIFAYMQDKKVIEEDVHGMDLPRTASRLDRNVCARLRVLEGRATLDWTSNSLSIRDCGSASRRKL